MYHALGQTQAPCDPASLFDIAPHVIDRRPINPQNVPLAYTNSAGLHLFTVPDSNRRNPRPT